MSPVSKPLLCQGSGLNPRCAEADPCPCAQREQSPPHLSRLLFLPTPGLLILLQRQGGVLQWGALGSSSGLTQWRDGAKRSSESRKWAAGCVGENGKTHGAKEGKLALGGARDSDSSEFIQGGMVVGVSKAGVKGASEGAAEFPEKGEPFVLLFPRINDCRGRHKGQCGVQPAAGQLLPEQLLCPFCHFQGWDCGWCLQNPGG